VLTIFNEELIQAGKKIINVKIAHSTDGENEKLNVEYVDEKQENLVDKTLFYKDRAHISDKNYKLLRKGLKLNTATFYKCIKRREQLKKKCPIVPLSTGYYLKPLLVIKVF
jgi:hypothetical protein